MPHSGVTFFLFPCYDDMTCLCLLFHKDFSFLPFISLSSFKLVNTEYWQLNGNTDTPHTLAWESEHCCYKTLAYWCIDVKEPQLLSTISSYLFHESPQAENILCSWQRAMVSVRMVVLSMASDLWSYFNALMDSQSIFPLILSQHLLILTHHMSK